MGQDVRPAGGGLLHDRRDLGLRVLEHVDRVRLGHHAARRADLDLVRTTAELVARGQADLVHPVGDPGELTRVGAGDRVTVDERAVVAVAARLAEGLAGHEQPGPVDQALLDRHPDADVAPTGVAGRREAPPEHRLELDPRVLGAQGRWHRAGRILDDLGGGCVDVGVDEARHQGEAAEFDHAEVRQVRLGERRLADLGDAIVDDEDVHARRGRRRRARRRGALPGTGWLTSDLGSPGCLAACRASVTEG